MKVLLFTHEQDIDAIGIVMEDKDSVSYRSIKDVDISVVADFFEGTGDKSAVSHPRNNDAFQKILKLIK